MALNEKVEFCVSVLRLIGISGLKSADSFNSKLITVALKLVVAGALLLPTASI